MLFQAFSRPSRALQMLYRCRTIAAVLDAARPSIADPYQSTTHLPRQLSCQLYHPPIFYFPKHRSRFQQRFLQRIKRTRKVIFCVVSQPESLLLIALIQRSRARRVKLPTYPDEPLCAHGESASLLVTPLNAIPIAMLLKSHFLREMGNKIMFRMC